MSWNDLGDAAGGYLASKSPIGGAIYQGVTGNAPPTQQDAGQQLANAIVGRYKRAGTPTNTFQPPQPPQAANPDPTPSENGEISDMDRGSAPSADQSAPQQNFIQGAYQSSQAPPTQGGGFANSAAGMGLKAAMPGLLAMQHGGIVGEPTMARVAERGPEMAGGQIIKDPSIVNLEKGDAVIPLTARPGNKLQPDMLEGHLAPPHPAGLQYSRYKSYGQGRGLMR